MNSIIMLLADESEEENVLNGMFASWQGIVGIVLILVSIAMVYMGIKVYNGYKIDFSESKGIPLEDTYVPLTAKIQNKVKTTVPDFNGGGERTFVEWTMIYEVDGEKYKQTIPDDEYEKGQMIDIKYDPSNPEEYYIYNKQEEENKPNTEIVTEEAEDEEKNKLGIVIIIVAVFIFAMACALMIDKIL